MGWFSDAKNALNEAKNTYKAALRGDFEAAKTHAAAHKEIKDQYRGNTTETNKASQNQDTLNEPEKEPAKGGAFAQIKLKFKALGAILKGDIPKAREYAEQRAQMRCGRALEKFNFAKGVREKLEQGDLKAVKEAYKSEIGSIVLGSARTDGIVETAEVDPRFHPKPSDAQAVDFTSRVNQR